jgi:small subunit ribosomal protein S8
MPHTDQIADMLTRIRNAGRASRKSVDVPASNLKKEIARILQEHAYIKKFVVLDDGKQGVLKILLHYEKEENAIRGIQRVSTPGRRVYKRASQLPRVLNGLGLSIVSTSKGLMSDAECRKMSIGGEVLCKVW